MPEKDGRTRQLLFKAVAVILGLCIALACGEALTRTLLKDKISLFPRYHTDARYGDFTIRKIRPNFTFTHADSAGRYFFKTNSGGFRGDYDVDYPKGEGVVRVLVLGDSHTQGYEANQNETFSFVLERYLRDGGVEADVINSGVSGFGTAEELVFLENEGFRYDPDFVVLGFFANDPEDNVKSGIFKIEDDGLVVSKREHVPGVDIQNFIYGYPILIYLGEHSYLYSLAFNTVWDNYKRLLTWESKESVSTEYAIPTRNVTDYEAELSAKLVERMHGFCREHNMTFVILDIPQESVDKSMPVASSIPPNQLDAMKANSDRIFYAGDLMNEYRNITPHNRHGQHHISAETHSMLGRRLGGYIFETINDEGNGS